MTARILVVDDTADDRDILRARLESRGYAVETAADGMLALAKVAAAPPDLILLDGMMPRLDGFATLARLRADKTLPFIPVIMLTAMAGTGDEIAGLEAGADEYLVKPVAHGALLARVKAMLRLKALQDEVAAQARALEAQAAELAGLNRSLQARVDAQVAEIEKMTRLKRFLAPQVAEAVMASADGEAVLQSHRREVAVLFCDLRGFTAFAESGEPEDVIALLRDYHAVVGSEVFRRGGTLERFAGDAIMVLFNDPVLQPDYCRRAVALAGDILARADALFSRWRFRGVDLGIGIGIAAGYATLGKIGFSDRYDYAAIGTVTNLAARLCARAESGQVLVSGRVAQDVDAERPARPLGSVELKGFLRPVPIYELG